MSEKELKKLSRADLLEMLISQSKEVQQLQEKLEKAEKELDSRNIMIDKAGSIAEASLQLNGVFSAVEAAGQQYLDNIRQLSLRQETTCARLEQECRNKVAQQLEETEKKCSYLEKETQIRCTEIVAKAKAESQAYWNEISVKLENFYREYTGLRELLSLGIDRQK